MLVMRLLASEEYRALEQSITIYYDNASTLINTLDIRA
jgi:hypothetical protein